MPQVSWCLAHHRDAFPSRKLRCRAKTGFEEKSHVPSYTPKLAGRLKTYTYIPELLLINIFNTLLDCSRILKIHLSIMGALLSLPVLGYFLAPDLTTYSTSLNLLFFYMVYNPSSTRISHILLIIHRHGAHSSFPNLLSRSKLLELSAYGRCSGLYRHCSSSYLIPSSPALPSE